MVFPTTDTTGMPAWMAVIAWTYLISNSARLLTYLPQILAVWRCRDGARSLSLLTWGSWVVSHIAAMGYGAWVVHDAFFFAVSAINLAGTGIVTALAAVRRWDASGHHPGRSAA